MKTWAYKTTWLLEDVPPYWQSVWGKKAFNSRTARRQWSVLDAAKFLHVKNQDDVAGSFSVII